MIITIGQGDLPIMVGLLVLTASGKVIARSLSETVVTIANNDRINLTVLSPSLQFVFPPPLPSHFFSSPLQIFITSINDIE